MIGPAATRQRLLPRIDPSLKSVNDFASAGCVDLRPAPHIVKTPLAGASIMNGGLAHNLIFPRISLGRAGHHDDDGRAVRAGLALIEAVGKLPIQKPLQVRIGCRGAGLGHAFEHMLK
jgi:hypothetical protein